ncbi:LLM class flavin-dependent oxidoreductase [Streptomyces radicis]|uniref:LLM class flavin-dependent oxidoreductase n=1 Tax=Streptomyces radicis TaxID=1750517 RepID=A0A3A9WJP4_9ACTN|nr:LLM class flavin-dependent oxidoreductase [Streptomyces radicis]RKN12822.1 LLM class flavin-dependent oxidoreductase [Streptomyces radicis]RKN27413.1 LLM class flavin-dependent oxidoreductase [Streptomyces radicis]
MTTGAPRIGLRVPPCLPADDIASFVARVEAQGFDDVHVPDSQVLWRDAYLTLFAAARATTRIGLGTAVSNVATRHPSVVASLARTVAEAAGGRFRLGLGVGNSSVEPVGLRPSTGAALRAGVADIRALLNGSTATFGDAEVRMRDPFPGVPIHVAASGPRNLRLAGEIADGAILLSGVAPHLLRRAVSLVRQGATEAGRDPDEVEIIVSAHALVTDDIERDARVLKPICAGIAQQGGQSALAGAGIDIEVPSRVPEVYPDLVHAEDWDLAVEHCSRWVSDEDAVAFARAFTLFGTPKEIAARVGEARDLGATSIFLQHVGSYDLPHTLAEAVATRVLPLLARQSSP